MTRYEVHGQVSGVSIELTDVGGKQQELLSAFGECRSGNCSCPTDQYDRLASMEVVHAEDTLRLRLEAKPGMRLDTAEIANCLHHTINKAETGP